MIKIFKSIKKTEILLVVISIVFIITQVWLDLKLPDYMSKITLLVQTEGTTIWDILKEGSFMLACALGSLVASVIVGYFAAKVAASFSKRLREKVFAKTLSFSMEEVKNFSVASLITRSTNDITQIQMIIAMGLQIMIKAPILAVWAIVKIAGKSWQWTAMTGGALGFLIMVIAVIVVFAIPKFKKIQGLTDQVNIVTRENLTGVRVVRAYNAEKYQAEKFEKVNEELTKTNLFTSRIMGIIQPSMTLINSGLSIGIYWIGATLINNAGMPDKLFIFSDMIVFSAYAMQVIMAFMMLTIIFIMLPRASVSAKRINEVLDTEVKIKDGDIKKTDEDIVGEVVFKNVNFKYSNADEYILHNINFTAKKGETVAFIGTTGSGKSTLINLIPRFYDVTEGEIRIDGINVKDYELETLYNKIGYASQKAVIFSGSVKSNIDYGTNKNNKVTDADIKKAASIAQADFVSKIPEGFDSNVAQSGANLSGGQKQRLSIARAICKKPEILIFDDSFSALDYKTDQKLRQSLNEETKDVTTFIVAQRIGTIKDVDKIIVLDKGEIVGMGKHQELLKNCEIYLEIAQSQLSKEELAYE